MAELAAWCSPARPLLRVGSGARQLGLMVEDLLDACEQRVPIGESEQLRQLVAKVISAKRTPTSVLQLSRPDSDERHFAIARLATRAGQNYQLHDAVLDTGPRRIVGFKPEIYESSLS